MSDHDAASVVGQMAGLDQSPAQPPVTPDELVARFCADVPEGLVSRSHGLKPHPELEGVQVARGFCGYDGGRGDLMTSGFDDGYSYMGFLESHGWRALDAKGDWPYLVYLSYRPREPYAIAEYCEADLTVWTFKDGPTAQAFYRGLKDAP